MSHSDHASALNPYPLQDGAYKASYDNLIDESTTSYAPDAKHNSYALQTSSDELPRDPSFLHAQKQSYSSGYSTKVASEVENNTHRGYPPPRGVENLNSRPRPFWRKILPESLACRLYITTVLVETAVDLVIEGDLLIRFQNAGPIGDSLSSRKMPVYLSVYAIAHVFQFIMAVDAVNARNTLQFLALAIFNALFLFYAVVQIGEIRGLVTKVPSLASDDLVHIRVDILTTILPIVIAVAEIAYVALGWKIYHEFGWKVYKFLGADRQIKRLYARYQIFQCLIKFDVFFFVGFSVQFISLVLLQKKDWEFWVTCAALPVSLILLVMGHLAARHENSALMFTFISGCVSALVYLAYKLFKLIKFRDTPQFDSIFKSLTTFSLIGIGLLIVTVTFAVIVMQSFGRGLKEALDRNQANPQPIPHSTTVHGRAMSKTLNRMSIE